MHRLNILLVLLIPLPFPGAAWTRVEFFARYLRNYNEHVAVLGAFSVKSRDKAGGFKWNGIKIYNLIPIIEITSYFPIIFSIISSIFVSFFFFLVTRPKVVIISVPSSGIALGCYYIARLFRTKIITDYRDQWEEFISNLPNDRFSRALLKTIMNLMTRCYCKSCAVVTVTEPFAKSLERRGIKDVRLVPNGADLTIFRPRDRNSCRRELGIPENSFVLVYSGYIGGYYRLDIVLRALKQAYDTNQETNTRLMLIGRGIGLSLILELADSLSIRDKIIYLGKTSDKQEIVNALCASDVGIIPYDSNPLWKNSLPVKSLEYLACGLPIVATTFKDSLLGKLIVENELGLLAVPEDIECLSEAITRIKKDVSLREQAGRRAISIIHRNYDRYRNASELYRIVKVCLNDR